MYLSGAVDRQEHTVAGYRSTGYRLRFMVYLVHAVRAAMRKLPDGRCLVWHSIMCDPLYFPRCHDNKNTTNQ
jgi:hypothetical protein